MINISSLLLYDKEFSAYLSHLSSEITKEKKLPILLNGVTGGAVLPVILESVRTIKKETDAPTIVIVPTERLRSEIASFLSDEGVMALEYKARDLVFHNVRASHDVERERLSVLSAIINKRVELIVTTPEAAMTYTVPEEIMTLSSISLSAGDEISPDELSERLIRMGFLSSPEVDGCGQFSRRGGILDIWYTLDKDPVRIEFFGDEIDRLVYFDPITQRATENAEKIEILPAGETLVSPKAKEKIKKAIISLIDKCTEEENKTRLKSELSAIEGGLSLDFRDKYLGIIYGKTECLYNYIDRDKGVVIAIDPAGISEAQKKYLSAIEGEISALLENGLVTKEAAKYCASQKDNEIFLSSGATVYQCAFTSGLGNIRASGIFGIRTRRTVSYGDNASMLIEDLTALRKSMYKTVLLAQSKQSAATLCESLTASEIAVRPVYDAAGEIDFSTVETGSILVDVGNSEGFDLIGPKIAVLSMKQDSGRAIMANRRRQRIMRKVGKATERLMSHADLSVGDYVVHANYGIGLFEGMQAVTVGGVTKDYITIRYAGTDKLFVPCDRLEYIGKYIGERDSDGKVKLSKMGGADWTRAKSKTKAAVKDIAKDLIRLYAERQRLPGFAFPPDSELEYEFAADFEFEETESQLIAISEIKADMMRPTPMNRLLCGDVGFGKTEVALRAAFKAIMGGKQVAILVPTTILAMQHYETALSRMRPYPVTVDMISRFSTKKEEALALRRAKRGESDILVGTHKLLSGSVEFRDLGLLIIDEEQRFGVTQKERLKEISKNVDVLTLSATPIPRTLSMAMNGISDMSILDEAPGDRRPVQTYVLEHDDAVITDALMRELNRGGQSLYLYNRVEEIEYVADKIMKAIPEARVAVAHGRMEKDELEDIWQLLVKGEIDILVCTTIIETGIDLPNANTLIIENSDRMGLSQLHQIRGRVGRSSRQAYAYFTYRRGKALSEIAEKRLAAIREFAEFGAGFKVALRDLEIRGAGNLLGVQQHGYIDSVGYDLYVKLLSEAVLEESGRTPEKPFESTVETSLSAYIPERYIDSAAFRMEMYKKISLISDKVDMDDVYDEFCDRFGEVPREVTALLKISLIRSLSSKAKIKKTEILPSKLVFVTEAPDISVWSELFGKFTGLIMRAGEGLSVTYKLQGDETGINMAISILSEYVKCMNK